MSFREVTEMVCDICGNTDMQRHYEITLREWSTINCDYMEPRTIHFCLDHEMVKIPYHKLFEKPQETDNG